MLRRSFGTGSIYQRGDTWWIQWRDHAGRHRQSAKTTSKKLAERLLRKRLAESDAGDPAPDVRKTTTLAVLCEMVLADYRANGRSSVKDAERASKHLKRVLGEATPAEEIDEATVTAYIATRLAEPIIRKERVLLPGAKRKTSRPVQVGTFKPATVNRELAFLRRAFRLAVRSRRLPRRPDFSTLRENNVRKGFVEREQLEEILARFPAPHLQRIIRTAYITGWRMRSELFTRRRHHADLGKRGWLRLEPGETKSRKGRQFPLTAALRAVLEEQDAATRALERELGRVIPWLFHDERGEPLKEFYGAWRRACRDAGLPGRFIHDFRRSAVRNLIRDGVSQRVAMAMVGMETDSIFERYAIVDEQLLQEAAARMDAAATARSEEIGHKTVTSEVRRNGS
jgi:integrase